MSSKEIAYIEWDSKGKIVRIFKSITTDAHLNPLDRLANRLRSGPYLEEYDVNWCERDQMYYYNKVGYGFGSIFLAGSVDPKKIRFKFWSDMGIELFGWNERTEKTRKLTESQIKKLGYDRASDIKWTDDITVGNDMYDRPPAAEGECYWCDACEDMLPKDDPCEHTFSCTAEGCDQYLWPQPTHCPDHDLCGHFKKKSKRRVKS